MSGAITVENGYGRERSAVTRLVLLVLLMLACGSAIAALPSYQEVKDAYRASDVRVLDRDGGLLQRVRRDYEGRRGDWIALGDISPALQSAVIFSEDRRFYSHSGVDWEAVAAAAWGNLWHDQRRGASTISMQLVALLDAEYRRGSSGRTWTQKIDQAIEARELDRGWTKPQILEAYLNLVAFRGELVGVDALARVLFQKHPSGLDAREAAVAAALLRGPNASRSVLTQRACGLLSDLNVPQECRGLNDFIYRSLLHKSARRADTDSLAPHYARLVLGQHPLAAGQSVRTSIDGALQRYVMDSVDRHVRALQASNVRDAAVVVLDNSSGQVLAYVGSSGGLSLTAQVDNARALRQAGSTLKPFLYAQALEQERLTTVSLLNDAPLSLPTGNGLYIPQNYDKHFSGWVSVRTALASSLNIPAVRTLVMVTPDAFQQRLVKLGLPLDRSGDFYGYSLALGSADVTLLSLTNAYRALANLGRYSSPRFLLSSEPTPQQPVFTAAAAWIVGDILSDRHARTRTFGLDSPLTTPFWSAVKTGTSKDMRDNWTVGWSQHYTVGVWVGNSHGDSMREVSGVSGAGPIWHDVISYLQRGRESRQPPKPVGVVSRSVVFDGNIEPARKDVFLGDTEVGRVHLSADLVHADQDVLRIIRPVNGTILALDPDIPPANQRAVLSAANLAGSEATNVQWRIDREVVGHGGELAWMPWPGKHRIDLLDALGNVLDTVHIEVRGASVRKTAQR
ncbi:penicillin-binding protein 1C [Paralcaligenes sp. KSB-10]|uniref:penicillin-binding protein 1C n=1 Tax=Paralcaligenes sp. KSB-10 TaxID=2901142 RepID=UPI00351D8C42